MTLVKQIKKLVKEYKDLVKLPLTELKESEEIVANRHLKRINVDKALDNPMTKLSTDYARKGYAEISVTAKRWSSK